MTRKLVARGLLSVMLAAALFSLFRLPAEAESVYQEITGMDGLISGQYVMVTPMGLAPGELRETEFMIAAKAPVIDADTVVDTAGAEWILTVTEDGVTLMDAYGASIAPFEDGSNGVTTGEYAWQVSLENGYFSIRGYSGDEPVTLVSDAIYDYNFRVCRDTDIALGPASYESRFTLYRYTEAQVEPEPKEPEPVKTSPKVTVSPEGGIVAAGDEITLSCEDETADIYFALSADGADYPEAEPYIDPIRFEKGFGTVYLKAYSIAEGCEPGEATQVIFTEKFELDWNLYFGQLHAHTDISDGDGSVEDAFQYASQVDGLDFFAVTDHSDSFDNAGAGAVGKDGTDISADWAAGKRAAASVTGEDFVGLFGFEMTWPEDKQLGHISTFNTPGWQTRDQEAFTNVTTALENYYKALTTVSGSVSQFNHPDDIHGNFERFDHYSPKYDAAVSLLEVAGEDGVVDCAYYDLALDEGWHVAPTNNQNNHNGQWGDASDARTVVLAKTLTEESLYAAMKDRRVYATQDSDLAIFYELNGAVMGSILPKSKKAEITVFLSDPTDEAIGKVEVVADGGEVLVSKYVGTPAQMLELSVPGGYSYYYLRVTQPDGDVAVTAPVWMDGYDDIGIERFISDTAAPARDEEIGLTVTLFNDEPVDFAVESLSIYADDKLVETVSKPGTVAAMDTLDYTFYYAHPELGVTEFRVEVTGSVNEDPRTYEDTLGLSFHVPEQHIVVDASHDNSGLEQLNRLAAIAAQAKITVKPFSEEKPKNGDILLITAPSKSFDEEFVEKVRTFVENGGTVILCGQADKGHTSGEMNKLLEAMGATVRLNDDTAGSISTNVFNPDSGLTKSLTQKQTYTQRVGCTVNPGSGTWLVKSRSVDANGLDTGKGAVLLAFEKLSGGGKVYVSGGLFLEDSAMKEPDKVWKSVSGNQGIVEALLKIERAAYPELVTIGEMRSGKAGEIYHIRGWATSGTSHPGNIFSRTIYLQDDTGGVALVPFTEDGIQVGKPIEVVGRKEIRSGNVVMKIIDYEVLDEPLYNYTPKTTPNKTAMDYEANGGRLMQVEGKVTKVTYTDDRKVVSRIILKDGNGDLAEILIENGIVSGADGENDLASRVKKGRTVRAIGLLHLDSDGTPVLRVRNCDEVVYVPPVPVSGGSRRNPRTGDLIWIAVGVMALSGIGLAVLLKKRKK